MLQHIIPSILVTAGCMMVSVLYVWLFPRKKAKAEWVEVGEVAELWLYPLKSCHGIKVSNAITTPLGLKYKLLRDRTFIVIDEHGKHLNCRTECPLLVTIRVEEVPEAPDETAICLLAPGMDPFTLIVEDSKKSIVLIRIWESNLNGWDMGDGVAEWLQNYLNQSGAVQHKYRLVYFDNSAITVRRSRDRKKPYSPLAHPEDKLAFSDFSALHVTCSASLSDVNQRLVDAGEKTLSSSHFRPNIHIKTSVPFTEDQWKFIKIGSTVLRVVKPTQRCLMMALDTKDGIRNPKLEPLKTLRGYRLATDKQEREWFKDAPLMGLNVAVDEVGELRTRDKVYALM